MYLVEDWGWKGKQLTRLGKGSLLQGLIFLAFASSCSSSPTSSSIVWNPGDGVGVVRHVVGVVWLGIILEGKLDGGDSRLASSLSMAPRSEASSENQDKKCSKLILSFLSFKLNLFLLFRCFCVDCSQHFYFCLPELAEGQQKIIEHENVKACKQCSFCCLSLISIFWRLTHKIRWHLKNLSFTHNFDHHNSRNNNQFIDVIMMHQSIKTLAPGPIPRAIVEIL